MTEPAQQPLLPAGIQGYPGPFAVGRYAARLRDRLREFPHVCLIGEVVNVSLGPKKANVYFELRDRDGAVPCAMWRTDFDRMGLPPEELRDGVEVVVAGGADYYPGGAKASPSFSFRVKQLRLAGEGDLLARLQRLRRKLAEEGLFQPQKSLRLQLLPRRLGVVTAEGSAARRDFLAGLERRGWGGTIVWGYAPVQDRRAAPRIAAALRDLAAVGGVDAIVVTRGGGSIADLWAFCDEMLCRTVALLPVPVISAVGHEVDRTLLDDVAAVSCSTPTHAAEAAVGVDCRAARAALVASAARLDACSRAAMLDRARPPQRPAAARWRRARRRWTGPPVRSPSGVRVRSPPTRRRCAPSIPSARSSAATRSPSERTASRCLPLRRCAVPGASICAWPTAASPRAPTNGRNRCQTPARERRRERRAAELRVRGRAAGADHRAARHGPGRPA